MGSVDVLIGRARRRWISNLLLNEAVVAACAALCGLIVVLLAGTDLLEWYWILPAAALGLAAGAWRLKRKLPGRYAVAQAIDRRLNLRDSISTAYFYAHQTRRRVNEKIRAAQYAEAEALAAGAALDRAVPYVAPKSLYAMAVLGLAASGLLAVRYGVAQRLDLKAPFPKLVLDIFHFTAKAQPIAKKHERDKHAEDLLKQFGLSLDSDAQKGQPGREEQVPAANSEDAERSDPGGDKSKAGAQGDPEGEQEQSGESEAAGLSIPQEGDQGRQTSSDQPGAQASNGRPNPGASRESNNLLDKFRDALANLMSRLKMQPRGAEGQQAASAGQDQGQGKQGQQGSEQSAAGAKSKGMPGGQGQGDQEGQGAEQAAEGGQGSQSSRDGERASQEGRSGIGKDDGSKDVHAAEQLAAMGKISEIFGKRSQTLTGEMMVEVTSSKQQLRTPYSQQTAAHADSGGEIHRDEVPLAYQRYVQQYFNEIRKVPPVKLAEPPANSVRP